MKNLLLGSIILTLFAVSFSLIQISCSKTTAQTTSLNLTQLDKVIYAKTSATGGGGNPQVWTANYDGTNAIQIPIALSPTTNIANDLNSFSLRLSPDGQKIFFMGYETSTTPYTAGLYSCNIDGSNVQIVVSSTTEIIKLGGAY
jgi:hypothetical protein